MSAYLEVDARSTARWMAIIALAFAALHIPSLTERYRPNSWLFGDGAFYYTTMRSLTEHGQLEQRALHPQSWYDLRLGWNDRLTQDWSNVTLGRNGGWYPKHPILVPILGLPLYLLFGIVGTLFTNILFNLVFVWLVFLISRRIARVEIAAVLAVLVAGMPFIVQTSYSFSNDILGADLLLGAIELTLNASYGWAGVLAGLAVWSRVTNIAYLPGLMIIGWDRGGLRAVGRAALHSLIPLGIFGAFNTYEYGAPWIISYQRVIARDHAQQIIATHDDLFTVPWDRGFRNVVTGGAGAISSYLLFIPGLLALPVLAWRRWALALGVVLFCTLPAFVLMKYVWYRPQFLYPIFGAVPLGLAAVGNLIVPPNLPVTTTRAPLRWKRPALIGVVAILIAAAGWRWTHWANPALLSSHMREARVFLDDIPCDYWNPQDERWECSHFDPDAWAMTGHITRTPAMVHGEPRRGIWLAPSPTHRTRRLVFPSLDARSVSLDFALTDDSRPGDVAIQILPRGEAPVPLSLSRPGEDESRTVNIQPGAGPALEIRVQADQPATKHVVLEGTLAR